MEHVDLSRRDRTLSIYDENVELLNTHFCSNIQNTCEKINKLPRKNRSNLKLLYMF